MTSPPPPKPSRRASSTDFLAPPPPPDFSDHSQSSDDGEDDVTSWVSGVVAEAQAMAAPQLVDGDETGAADDAGRARAAVTAAEEQRALDAERVAREYIALAAEATAALGRRPAPAPASPPGLDAAATPGEVDDGADEEEEEEEEEDHDCEIDEIVGEAEERAAVETEEEDVEVRESSMSALPMPDDSSTTKDLLLVREEDVFTATEEQQEDGEGDEVLEAERPLEARAAEDVAEAEQTKGANDGICSRAAPPDSPPPELAALIHQITALRRDAENTLETISLGRRVLAQCRSLDGDEEEEEDKGGDSLRTLLWTQNLAALLHDAATDNALINSEAESLYRRALTGWDEALMAASGEGGSGAGERAMIEQHALAAANNLAGLLHDAGMYDAAEPLYRRVLVSLERSVGATHSATLTTRHNFIVAIAALPGRLEEGRAMCRVEQGKCEDALGASDEATALFDRMAEGLGM